MNKVLIIDDDIDHRVMIETRVREAGGEEISFAVNGHEGVQKALEDKPDVIVVDVVLPGIDGFEVCKEIKEFHECKAKIVVMTAYIAAIDPVRAKKCGADDFCAKTGDLMPLKTAVENLLHTQF